MIKLNVNDCDLLASIADYKILTVKQLSIVSRRSSPVVRRRIRALEEGVVTTSMEAYGGGRGRPENVLFLIDKGTEFPAEQNGGCRP